MNVWLGHCGTLSTDDGQWPLWVATARSGERSEAVALADVRYAAHFGLMSDIRACVCRNPHPFYLADRIA
jgi:hypothetical protein